MLITALWQYYGVMIDPVAADHSGGPTNHWIIHLELQVNQFLFTHWFFFSFSALSEENTSLQTITQPSTLEGSDQRNQEMQSAFSLCFNTLSSSYRSITNLPARANVIFLPPLHLSPTCIDPLPPGDQCQACGGCSKNCNYSERGKFLGDNSLFHPPRTWKSQRHQENATSTHISINSTMEWFLNTEDVYVHVWASPALPRVRTEQNLYKNDWFSSRRNKVSNKSSHDTKGWGRITNKWVRFAAFQQPS